jgi:hypothetical protein
MCSKKATTLTVFCRILMKKNRGNQSEIAMKPNTVGRAAGESAQRYPFQLPFAGGLPSGTIVLSQDGEIPVEFLSPGDRVITRDAGLVTLRDVVRIRDVTTAVRFAAGSLGHMRPDQDLVLPADQKVLIRDWRAQSMFGQTQAMVSASRLIDGEFVRDLGRQTMILHQLVFDRAHVIYAGGLELAGADASRAGLQMVV